ncbi:probable protein phosphatase 2C 74 [Asparagus officinalis]|nr:probable protein phosphatase 2C 74 [Asparagus officinalis]
MVDHQVECLWSLLSFIVHLFNVVRKTLCNLLASRKALRRLDSSKRALVNKLGCGFQEEEKAKIEEDATKKKKNNMVDHVGGCGAKGLKKARKRPAMISIPENVSCADQFVREEEVEEEKDVEVEGGGYCLVSRRGKRHLMEDGYGVISDINGDSKQAFFGVFDGHGGRAAVDFVSENLGENIIRAIDRLEEGEDKLEMAMRSGYLTTDREFLSQGVNSGACAATVLLKDGELHIANVGDCKVVMSRNKEAKTLTVSHNPGTENERNRIESLGGYVSCRNGTWRVQDSLAISRSIGDANLKEWIISEPETRSVNLTPDCEFLVLASDGLWDKVSDEEAVNVVLKNREFMKSCKDLVEMSCRRGNRDDITVMIVNLQSFV